MRDIPIFTTEYGVASLILKEIPYKNIAYIRIRTVLEGKQKELLGECAAFCRMAGAERIFYTAEEEMDNAPIYNMIYQMRGPVCPDPSLVASLFPVTEETVGKWRSVYQQAMKLVDNAATLESRDEKEILQKGGAYFVHEDGTLLGIGWLEGNRLLAIASAAPGTGPRVLHTLMTLVREDTMELEVASTNTRALRFYEKMGFLKTAEVSRWYLV